MNFSNRNWWKFVTFLIYTALLGTAIIKHEPWFDEAQAWLLARDSSVFDLLVKYLRYEGSTGLWHLILVLPAKAGLPYMSINIISGALAAFSVYLFLIYSPFPAFVKILYPFSFYAFYQYAVVARSYSLLPPVLFLTAIFYKYRIEKLLSFVFLLFLLSNISLHGLIIAGSLAAVYLVDIRSIWYNLTDSYKKKYMLSMSLLGLVFVLIVFQLKPPADLISLAAFRFDKDLLISKSITMLSDSMAANHATGFLGSRILHYFGHILSMFSVLVTLIWLSAARKLPLYILPATGLLLLFSIVYSNVWHQGSLFFLWLFALWVSFEEKVRYEVKFAVLARHSLLFCLTAVILIQIYWSYNSFKYDFSSNYSSSRELADFIKEANMDEKKIYISGFYPISTLPYFNSNIFCNYNNGQKPCFWFWSNRNAMYREPFELFRKYEPDFIILSIRNYANSNTFPENIKTEKIPGYRLLRLFTGGLFWKENIYELDSFALYEKIVSQE